MAFWRPGAAAPGVGIERPEDFNDAEAASTIGFNPRHSLPLQQQRNMLPIARVRNNILYAMEKYRTLVIVGETGSGKSTQIPQYLYEAGWTQGGRTVLCTQPRRMAATSVAARVATEMGCALGTKVGYAVRFDQKVDSGGSKTAIKFVTDGLLLRETLFDPLLSSYSVIMLDEAHERSIYTDVLLGLLKKVRRRRPDLRIIISSATADAEDFRNFFEDNVGGKEGEGKDSAIIVSITGRQHDVDVLYSAKSSINYIQSAMETVLQIVKSEGPGDILVFLPGMEEIDQAVQKTRDAISDTRQGADTLVLPLYSSLPHHLQIKAIAPAARHIRRKIIFATNIAETSLTIDGVKFVVDSGFVKLPIYDVKTGFESLVVSPISKASATQRAGRAGRTSPGKCFRLYTQEAFLELKDHTLPEIQRSNLAWMVLQLKALGIDEVMTFDFISQPSAEAMIRGLELLYALGALDDKCKLTPGLGEKMAEFPVEPRLSKVLLSSFEFGCTEEVLTIVALLQVQNLWTNPKGRDSKDAQEEAMAEVAALEGDHVTLVNLYAAYLEAGKAAEWCQERFINHRSLQRATEIRGQLRKYLERYKPPGGVMASCCEDSEALRKCIVSGFFFNAARMKSDGRYYTVRGDHPVQLHPTSVLAKYGSPPEWVVYHDVILTKEEYIRDCIKIRPQWLLEQAPHFYQTRGRIR